MTSAHARRARSSPGSRAPARGETERRAARALLGHVGIDRAGLGDQVVRPVRLARRPEHEAALDRLIPLSRSQRENVDMLRRWLAEGRAQSASFEEPAPAAREAGAIPAISPE